MPAKIEAVGEFGRARSRVARPALAVGRRLEAWLSNYERCVLWVLGFCVCLTLAEQALLAGAIGAADPWSMATSQLCTLFTTTVGLCVRRGRIEVGLGRPDLRRRHGSARAPIPDLLFRRDCHHLLTPAAAGGEVRCAYGAR